MTAEQLADICFVISTLKAMTGGTHSAPENREGHPVPGHEGKEEGHCHESNEDNEGHEAPEIDEGHEGQGGSSCCPTGDEEVR